MPPTVSSQRRYPWRPRAAHPPGQPGPVQPESSGACFHTFKFILNSFHWMKRSLSLFFLCIKFQLASMAESSWTWPWNNWSIIRLVVSLARLTLSDTLLDQIFLARVVLLLTPVLLWLLNVPENTPQCHVSFWEVKKCKVFSLQEMT